MRVTQSITAQRLSVDETYQRFFDGYYNLGQPGEIFERNVVLGRPRNEAVKAPAGPTNRRLGRARRRMAGGE